MAALNRLPRLLLLLAALFFLILGLFAGLMRLGWNWPLARPMVAVNHGPLMICGFLGTLISLERAVALGRSWGYAAPAIVGVGTLGLVAGISAKSAMLLIMFGSLVLVFIFIAVLLRQPALYTATMSLGAGAWLAGNVLLLTGITIPRMVHWWIGFLVLTIVGERLELNRLLAPSRYTKSTFGITLALFLAGLICTSFLSVRGDRIAGVGMLAMALWLARYDVARLTVHRAGLPRFIAVSLFAGYGWLGVGGLIWALAVPVDAVGSFSFVMYDAMLHSIFLGFVFSMIFAHAPIIFPAVAGRPLAFRRVFYSHLGLLHLSLVGRVAGDLSGWFWLFRWAGLWNVIALVLFLANSVYGMVAGQHERALKS